MCHFLLFSRFHASKIRCNVALALLDGVFEGSPAIPAMQRVSFVTAAVRAACEPNPLLAASMTSGLPAMRAAAAACEIRKQ